MDVDKAAFFQYEISEILNLEKTSNQPGDLTERVELFVRDCAGAADSEMDISFQENGRGYYAHLHELERLRTKSKESHLEYRSKLISELKEAEENHEMTHQMKVVYSDLLSKKDEQGNIL